jgi:hypothetical protein
MDLPFLLIVENNPAPRFRLDRSKKRREAHSD